MSSSSKVARRLVPLAVILALSGTLAFTGHPALALTAAECAALSSMVVPSTTITATAVIAASPPLPEYCRV
jgi:hypothetical protein